MDKSCIEINLKSFLERLDAHGIPYNLREAEKDGLFISKGDIVVEGVFPLKIIFSKEETEDGKQMAYGMAHYAEGMELLK